MKYRKKFLNVLMLIVLCCTNTRAEVIINPSFEFEHGGLMPNGYDISGWDTWGMPDDWAWRNFGNTNGHAVRVDALSDGWSSNGDWSLYIFASTVGRHEPGHYIEFYQFVNLTDVDAIIFDARLMGGIYSNSYFAVNSQKVWVHNQAGEFPNVTVDVSNFSGICEIAIGVEVFKAFGDTADGWTYFDNIRAVLDSATLLGIEIVGPEQVTENFSARFKAIAYNNNAITTDVTDWVIWSVEPQTYASIDENGLLHTGDINIPKDITIYAKYTIGNVTFEADTNVRITLPYILSVPTEYATIQEAINAAEDSDIVLVADGIYASKGNRDIDFKGKAITVCSQNGPNNCIIDCETLGRGFYFHKYERANSLVEGFTITNGYANYGGAILCRGSSPTIANCIIRGNYGDDNGGGIACRYSCSPTISGCIIAGNSARYNGGGIDCYHKSTPPITNCTITGNMANEGGGICFWDSSTNITNCIISGNLAEYNGGGIWCWEGKLTINNCTITNNSAYYGGGICFWGSGEHFLSNCILYYNKAPEEPQIYLEEGSFVLTEYSNIQGGYQGKGNIDLDPCFVQQGYWDPNGTPEDVNAIWVQGDYHLLPNSPCIDTGDPNYIPEPNETDLDGNPRVMGPAVDMGAYEYEPPIPAQVNIEPDTLNLASKGKWITCRIRLPEDYSVTDIDPNSVYIEDIIAAERFEINNNAAIVKFSRSEAQSLLSNGENEITLTGELLDGTIFEGADTIRIITKQSK